MGLTTGEIGKDLLEEMEFSLSFEHWSLGILGESLECPEK